MTGRLDEAEFDYRLCSPLLIPIWWWPGRGGIIVVECLFQRLIIWMRDSPTRPDPWDVEVERKLANQETLQVCPHCSTSPERERKLTNAF